MRIHILKRIGIRESRATSSTLYAACLASSKQALNQHCAIVQPSVPGRITSIFYLVTVFLLLFAFSLWHARSVLASAISYTSPSSSSTCLSCLVSSFVLYIFIFIISIKPTFLAADRRSHSSSPFSHLSSPSLFHAFFPRCRPCQPAFRSHPNFLKLRCPWAYAKYMGSTLIECVSVLL